MTKKIIVGAAIAAVAVTLLLTFSNTAYSSPIGDEVFIRVHNENVDESITVTVQSGSPEFTVTLLAFLGTGPSELTIDIDVDTNGDGTIWLTYTSDNEKLVPFHNITIQGIDWIDPSTGNPIPGIIVDVQCESGLVTASFTDDTIQLLMFPAFELTDIHCTFFAEHETSEPACIAEHWDKIIFQILRDPSKTINPDYLKTPLDIKVLDDPTSVANLVVKVKEFIAANGIAVVSGTTFDPTIVPQLKIDIIDVEYAIVCIPLLPDDGT